MLNMKLTKSVKAYPHREKAEVMFVVFSLIFFTFNSAFPHCERVLAVTQLMGHET